MDVCPKGGQTLQCSSNFSISTESPHVFKIAVREKGGQRSGVNHPGVRSVQKLQPRIAAFLKD
jgi:hypothetical protein